MTPTVKQMDQTNWTCFQLPNNSYYYGQTGYLDESGVVNSKDNAEAANNPKNKLVRHGFGVYLYQINEQTQKPSSLYEGRWDKDNKSGQGKLKLADGTTYEGGFMDGCYHGTGKMTWLNGDCYEGLWKRNKMDGAGSFKHHQNFTLKGIFKANYFIDQDILRNPKMSEKEYTQFKKERKEIIKQKEKQQKIKHGFVEKVQVSDLQKIKENLSKSISNNRVPLVTTSIQSNFTLQNLKQLLRQQFQNIEVNEFDLRKAYTLKGEEKQNYRNEIQQLYRDSLTKGQVFLVNLDQSPAITFNQMFYPDIKQFYESNGFNYFSWSRDQLDRIEIKNKIISDKESISPQYRLIVWSKYKIQQKIPTQSIQNKLQSRFQKIIPFIKIDCVFLCADQAKKEEAVQE